MKRQNLLLLTLPLAALSLTQPAQAFCPCYTASSPNNNNNCAIEAANGINPTVDEWNTIFALVSKGPAAWGNQGPTVDDIGQGCGKPEAYHLVPASFPCELLKGIAKVETGWRQFCIPDTPSDQVGGPSRTIISFDCGYGIGQVTSGMHVGENPTFDRQRVAAEPIYNLATGTRILASKWKATNCVGDNQPKVVEHWYTATWAYNGLAYVNNPNNPNYSSNRGVYNPQAGGAAPYQEKVFGWMENTNGQWTGVPLAYPNPGEIGAATNPPDLSEPTCASPTNCINTRPSHITQCEGSMGSGGGGTSSSSTSGGTGGNGGTGGSMGSTSGTGGNNTGGSPTAGVGGGGIGGSTGAWGEAGNDANPTSPNDTGTLTCHCHTTPTPTQPATLLATLTALTALLQRRRQRRR